MNGVTDDHLYVIGDSDVSSVVKIGRSGDPHSRLADLQTGSRTRLVLLHVELAAGPLEGDVHKLLARCRTNGEWFDFGTDAALPLARQAIADAVAINAIASRYACKPARPAQTIHPRGPLPPYRQIAAWLEKRIEAGEFAADEPLPSEQELIGLFGVARETARRAVRYLAEQGLIVVVPGRGSYVRRAP